MPHTPPSNTAKTIAIIHGAFEGPAISRRLTDALHQAGFVIVQDPAAADIIFAHSGGCYLVPPKNQAKLVVLAGLPYWPGRPWVIATAKKLLQDAQLRRDQHNQSYNWLRKELLHARYTSHVGAHLRMWFKQNIRNDWNGDQPQVIIRNQHDAYCRPDITELPFRGPRTFISFPGGHDDCWDNPKSYVRLLQSLL